MDVAASGAYTPVISCMAWLSVSEILGSNNIPARLFLDYFYLPPPLKYGAPPMLRFAMVLYSFNTIVLRLRGTDDRRGSGRKTTADLCFITSLRFIFR